MKRRRSASRRIGLCNAPRWQVEGKLPAKRTCPPRALASNFFVARHLAIMAWNSKKVPRHAIALITPSPLRRCGGGGTFTKSGRNSVAIATHLLGPRKRPTARPDWSPLGAGAERMPRRKTSSARRAGFAAATATANFPPTLQFSKHSLPSVCSHSRNAHVRLSRIKGARSLRVRFQQRSPLAHRATHRIGSPAYGVVA